MMKRLVGPLAVIAMALVLNVSSAAAQGAMTDPNPATDAQLSGAGVTKKAQFQSDLAQVNITTNVFTTVSQTTVVLTAAGCIQAHWTAENGHFGVAEGGGQGAYRVLVNGLLMEPQGTFSSPDGNSTGLIENVALHAWRCGLGTGAHTVQVQVANNVSAGTHAVRRRSLSVHWKK
jgi:hypothetical protein